MAAAISLSSCDTEYSADAIEFCPTNPLLFVCGTYQIVKEDVKPLPIVTEPVEAEDDEDEVVVPQVTRFGRCLLYEIDSEGGSL